MRKIVLFLSGEWTSSISRLIEPDDILIFAPGLKPSDCNLKCIELEPSIKEYEREVTDFLVDIYLKHESTPSAQYLGCFLNDFYSYSLKPLIAIVLGLKKWINNTEISEILVITARPMGNRIPMVGFQTTESSRGSRNLLNSRLAALLPIIFSELNFSYKYIKGDLLCIEPFRQTLVGSANICYIALLASKTILLNLFKHQSTASEKIGNIVIVRNGHQARFASRLKNEKASVFFAVLPQATQGSLKELLRLQKQLSSSFTLLKLSPNLVLRAVSKTWIDLINLRKFSRSLKEENLKISGLSIPIKLSDITSEIQLISVTVFYKNILSNILKSSQAARLINFELVGRMAGLEAMAARENDTINHSIQSALISSRPHPIFPYSDFFHTDSATTVGMIKYNGSKSVGHVVYSGPPYPLRDMKISEEYRKISFFTQPYEPLTTFKIISALSQWARSSGAGITLRLHPRDKPDKYNPLLVEFFDVLTLDTSNGVVQIIEKSDLCITRTSSVAKEALALGRPILLCLWSQLDCTAEADFILRNEDLNYCSHSDSELIKLLNNPALINKNSQQLRAGMFMDKTASNLSAEIFER